MSSPGLAGSAAAVGWGSTECFCLLCSLSTQSLFAAVHPLLPPLSFLRGLWCFPSCMLLFLDASPEPSVEAEAHFTQCCTCCSASLGTAQLLSASLTYRGGEDPAPPSPVNDFRLLSWTESHSAIREGSLRGVSERIPIHLHLVPSRRRCWSTPRCSPLAEAHFALPHAAVQ